MELCHYNGHIRGGHPDSWAAVSTCDGINGVIFDGTEYHHIEKAAADNATHFLYKQSDHFHEDILKRPKRSVSNSDKNGKSKQDLGGSGGSSRPSLRQDGGSKAAKVSKIKGPWNANKQSRYVELLLVVDNKEYQDHDEDLQKVYRICKDVANVMNALYSPLNIYIALVGVVVWTEYDEIILDTNGDTTLTNFLHYRRERLNKDHPNDNAQLLTGITFNGGVVGKALKGPMCTYEFSGGVNMWHSDVIGLVATTVAHEMGHNFGMEHDTEDCDCPDDRCIMAPASSTLKPSFWSSCSLEYLALAFEHGMDYCLRNKPLALFKSPVCGNGFVEKGEQCDCGLKHHCNNACCNPDTCTLWPNATCGTGECCDFNTCKPKDPGQMCRRSDHECDLPEFCTGSSEFCPKDVFKVDGTSCKVGQAFCYQGSCRTHSDQCKLLWGPSGKKSDNQCYQQNSKGSKHGNCGHDWLTGSYIPCPNDDVRCGMLHCSHLNERLEFGMESVAILSHSYINTGGKIVPCRTALVDLGLNDVDPGLAPEGSRCGNNRLCVNQKCMPVGGLMIGPHSCPNHCNGHGTCNSHGHCHCEPGYSPPHCISPGPGGSIDSGPASNPDEYSSLHILLFICLAILPIIFFCLLVVFLRSRGNWRLLMEKATFPASAAASTAAGLMTPDSKKKRDISGPLGIAGSGQTAAAAGERKGGESSLSAVAAANCSSSSSSSPSHALLPHVDTSTSALSELNGKKADSLAAAAASDQVEEVEYTGNSSSSFGGGGGPAGFFGGFSRSKLKRKHSTPVTDLEHGSNGGRGRNGRFSFMQNLARSITFPSAIKGSSRDSPKYEIKVEPKTENDSGSSSANNISSPVLNEEQEEALPSVAVVVPSSPVKAKTPSPTSPPPKPLPPPRPKTAPRPPPSSPPGSAGPVLPVPDIKNNPKLAFPHSSSFTSSGNLRTPFFTAASTGGKSFRSSQSSGSLGLNSRPNTIITKVEKQQLQSKAASPPAAATTFEKKKEESGLGLKKSSSPLSGPSIGETVVVDKKPIVVTSTESGMTSSTTLAPATTPVNQISSSNNVLKSKPLSGKPPAAVTRVTSPITATKPPVSQQPSFLKKQQSESSSSSQQQLLSSFKPNEYPRSSMTKTSTLPSSLAAAAGASRIPKSSTLPLNPSAVAEESADNSGGSANAGPSRPVIGKPVFQTATPSAASLISRAPSTGISQSSILAKSEKPEKKDRSSRGVVFCDPITLPSPTNPNNPPIIHQPVVTKPTNDAEESAVKASMSPSPPHESIPMSKATTATIFTPTWTKLPEQCNQPLSSDAVICLIDEAEEDKEAAVERKKTDSPAPMASPEPADPTADTASITSNNSSITGGGGGGKSGQQQQGRGGWIKNKMASMKRNSSLQEKEASPAPSIQSRNSFRNMEISSPVLQSSVDIKTKLVPVCNADTSSTASSPTPSNCSSLRNTSPLPVRSAPPPPVSPRDMMSKQGSFDSLSSQQSTGAVPKTSAWRSSPSQEKETSFSHQKPPLAKTAPPKVQRSLSNSSKRPASIATSRPTRPSAPPPRPPPDKPPPAPSPKKTPAPPVPKAKSPPSMPKTSKVKKSPSPVKDTKKPPCSEPFGSSTNRPSSIGFDETTSLQSPQDGDFMTPTGSPLFGKRSPDTISTASSQEGDLMKEILKEMDVKVQEDPKEEEIYSTLMRKKKNKAKKDPNSKD